MSPEKAAYRRASQRLSLSFYDIDNVDLALAAEWNLSRGAQRGAGEPHNVDHDHGLLLAPDPCRPRTIHSFGVRRMFRSM